jgi:hypothetical protein
LRPNIKLISNARRLHDDVISQKLTVDVSRTSDQMWVTWEEKRYKSTVQKNCRERQSRIRSQGGERFLDY